MCVKIWVYILLFREVLVISTIEKANQLGSDLEVMGSEHVANSNMTNTTGSKTIFVEQFNQTPKIDDYKNFTKPKHCNTMKHLPNSIWKLSISDKKSGNVMSMENPDQFIYSWVHYRFACDKSNKLKIYKLTTVTILQYEAKEANISTHRNFKSGGLALWSSTSQ